MTPERFKECKTLANEIRRLGPTYAGLMDDLFAEIEFLQRTSVKVLSVKEQQKIAKAIKAKAERGRHAE